MNIKMKIKFQIETFGFKDIELNYGYQIFNGDLNFRQSEIVFEPSFQGIYQPKALTLDSNFSTPV
jgi:hypothetical protein